MGSMTNILCLNCGSSSLKFSIFALHGEDESLLHQGAVDGIGLRTGRLEIRDGNGGSLVESGERAGDHGVALQRLLDALPTAALAELDAVGHRVVHGGPDRTGPARIDPVLREELRGRVPLAPLHLPQEIRVIEATEARWPALPQVACFDTAFHRRMPESAQRLPLPRRLFEAGVRRYGYHGLSYEYVRQALGEEARGRVIVAHLGHGSSLVALRDGQPIQTTMAFTPAGGVMMATRSGDLDPGVLLHLLDHGGFDSTGLARLVNEESGLLGVSGQSADMKRLLEVRDRDTHADQAISMYCASVRQAIGALTTELGGLDLLVFTGGIGERAATVRHEICQGLAHLGISSAKGGPAATSRGESIRVRVVPTNENLMIARQTRNLLFGSGSRR